MLTPSILAALLVSAGVILGATRFVYGSRHIAGAIGAILAALAILCLSP